MNQRKKGRWNPYCTNFDCTIFSYMPNNSDEEDNVGKTLEIIRNDDTFNNIKKDSSMNSFLAKEKYQAKKFSFTSGLKIETDDDNYMKADL